MITYSIQRERKNYEIQIRRPKSFLNLGVLVLMTGSVLSSQQDGAAGSGQLGQITSRPVDELSAQHLNGHFESFAPAVKRVSPAVVKIVTALRLEGPPDLAGGMENPLSRNFLGQVPSVRSVRLVVSGLGSGQERSR